MKFFKDAILYIRRRHIGRLHQFSLKNILYFQGLLIYLELMLHLFIIKTFSLNTFYILLLSLPIGLLLSLLTNFLNPKVNWVIAVFITVILCTVFCMQFIYHKRFGAFFDMNTLIKGGQALEPADTIAAAVLRNLIPLLFLLLPIILFVLFGPFISFKKKPLSVNALLAISVVGLHMLALLLLNMGGKDLNSPYDLYHRTVSSDLSFDKLGLFTTMRLDVKRYIWGQHNSPDLTIETLSYIGEADNEHFGEERAVSH